MKGPLGKFESQREAYASVLLLYPVLVLVSHFWWDQNWIAAALGPIGPVGGLLLGLRLRLKKKPLPKSREG